MTLDDLNAAVAKDVDLSKENAGKAVKAMLKSIEDSLKKGEKVTITGFGTFETVHRAEREGRNPQTGKAIKIEASNNVKFKPGKTLRDAVNG